MSKVTTVGDRVKLKYKTKDLVGVVKFIGSIKAKNGIYYGIELDKANSGEHNGDFKNIKYFTTARKKGIFVKKSAITKTSSKDNSAARVTIGSIVNVIKSDCEGIIKFIGEIESKKGIYYGIELQQAKGKNNGTVKGKIYFECEKNKGIFVKENGFEIISSKEKNSYNIKPKTKKQKSAASNSPKQAPASPLPSQTSAAYIDFSDHDINRRKDIEKVVSVLNGKGTPNDLNDVITAYDDKKENEDIEWLKIIATLKTIYDEKNDREAQINTLKQEIVQLKNENNTNVASVDDNSEELKQEINTLKEEINKLQQDNIELSDDKNTKENEYQAKISQLKQENVTLKNNIILRADTAVTEDKDTAELQRIFKFEKDEMKQKYESQIKTLQSDKQRLEKQILSSSIRPSASPVPPNNTNEEKESEYVNVDVDVEQLQKDKQQLEIVIRAKDEIIANAVEEIKNLKQEISIMKEEEEKEELQVDRLSRDRAKKLLQERVNDQQQGSLTPVTKSKTISELLTESTKEDAVSIIHSMGVMKFEYDKKLKKDTYNLDLTNNSVLRRLTNEQRKQFMYLLAHCICDSSGQQKVEKIKMSNMNIDDKLFPDFCDILIQNIQYFAADEWWLESNKIGNDGMKKFAQFLGLTPQTLEVVKMYNNKSVVSTPVINGLLSAVENNDKLQKFTFEWRLTQHRDRIEKQLKKNQDLKRKRKWAGK